MATKRGKTKMKKLLFLAAVVAMGVMNARAVSLENIDAFFDTEKVSDWSNYKTAYILTASGYDKWANGDFDTMKSKAIANVTLEQRTGGNLYFEGPRDLGGDSDSETSFFALLTDEKAYALMNAVPDWGELTFANESPFTSADIKPFAGAAPEPTSGLLLLLGVAGLALKRKRA